MYILHSLVSLFTFYISALIPAYSIFPSTTISYSPLGDSYASGNGAGEPIRPLCGGYSLAYPVLLAQYFSLTPVSETFYNEACGGATTWSVQSGQLGHVAESDVVTLTVGGNEVEFFATLNDCVYHWWDGRGCEAQMETTRCAIESTTLVENYSSLVRAIVQRLKPGAQLFVTGFGAFFNEDTEGCNGTTFSVKEPYQYLTQGLRKDLNDLVRLLNTVIQGATIANGAEYVDIDNAFTGHRFCEEGVNEPDASRIDTWFYNLDTENFQLRFPNKATQSHEINFGSQQKVFLAGKSDFEEITRVFHPTPEGHEAIANVIFANWKNS